jgi:hypothetical protein
VLIGDSMTVLSRSSYVLAVFDALIITFISFCTFCFVAQTYAQLFIVVGLFLLSIMFVLGIKGFYNVRKYCFKDIYLLFEGVFIGSFLAGILAVPVLGGLGIYLILLDLLLIFAGILIIRIFDTIYKKFLKEQKIF